jgi:CHC2 zinc finger
MAEGKGKTWVDFQELKASITFEQVLTRLALLPALERAGDELRGQCPICKRGDEKSKRFSVNVSKQVFQCFACKRWGNVLDFPAAMRGTDVHHAALWLCDEFLVNTEVRNNVQEEASTNGAVEEANVARSVDAPLPAHEEAASEGMSHRETLTEREAWLVEAVVTGIAWYLAEMFRPLSDAETIKHCIVTRLL